LKITMIRATPDNIPLEAPLWWTGGLYPGTSKAIVEVETDEGLVGLGEAPSADVSDTIVAMGEILAGRDPLDIAACERVCVPPWQIVQNTDDARIVKAFGAVEIALWDLRGKAWGQSLATLLGGKVRETVAFSEYFGFREGRETTPQAVADYCLAMREQHGSTIFEGKLIRGDPLLEVETVRLVREALGPSAEIRLDSNMQWSLTAARRVLRMLAD
jgi:glucarate dehydratase